MSDIVRIHVAIQPDEYELFFSEEATADLRSLGAVTFAGAGESAVVLPSLADTTDILLTSWSTEPFQPERVLGDRLRLAVHTGASVRGLFPKHVLSEGLRVVQAGARAMAMPVAEMALAMTLVMLRNVHIHDRKWQTTRDWQTGGNGMLGRGITTERIGVVGLSRTGKGYVSMLHGLRVRDIVAYDPYVTPEQAAELGVRLVGLEELCRTSGVVAVHAPATPETHHLIGATELALMADGTVVVNTARSWLVHETALIDEVSTGRLHAALDVFDIEPLPAESPLFGLPNVLLTPHVAGGTATARYEQAATAVAEIRRYLQGEDLLHEVTAQVYDRLG